MIRTALGSFLQMKNMREQLQPPSTPSSGILTYSEKIKYETDDVPLHYVMYNAKKSDWHNPFKQDLSLFDNVVTKVVGTSPFNIDGNKIYQIKCDEYTWKEKLSDGRHWQVNWEKNWQLNSERRVSKYQGSVVCMNDKCPVFQVHNIANEAAFSWSTLEGSYQC